MAENASSTDPKLQPYRNADDEVVTLTPEHCAAISRALIIYRDVTRETGKSAFNVDIALQQFALLQKSCLMGRLLYQGKPPLINPPPVVNAAPAYALEDPELCPNCGGPRNEPGKSVGASMEPPANIKELYEKWEKRPLGKTVTRVYCIEEWHPK